MSELYWLARWQTGLFSAAIAIACCAGLSNPIRADEKAEAVLAKATAAYKSATTLTATVSMDVTQDARKYNQTVTIQLSRPNLVSIGMTTPQKREVMSVGNDAYAPLEHQRYLKQTVAQNVPVRAVDIIGLPSVFFFGKDSYGFGKLSDSSTKKTYSGKVTVLGVAYDVVTIAGTTPFAHTVKLYVGPDGMIDHSSATITMQSAKVVQTAQWNTQ